MRDQDLDDFCELLDATLAMYPHSKPATDTQKALFFQSLKDMSLPEVRAGLIAHMNDPQRCKFPPLPGDVRAQVQAAYNNDGRPGADEAWAIAIGAADEAATLVWTEEMAEAWGVCRHVFASGDEVGARFAFRESYTRMVEEARRARKPAVWTTSLGHDAKQRDAAIAKAVELGRLPAPERLALPAPINSLAELTARAPGHIAEKLRALRDELVSRTEGPGWDAVEKQRTSDLKAEMAARVSAYGVAA